MVRPPLPSVAAASLCEIRRNLQAVRRRRCGENRRTLAAGTFGALGQSQQRLDRYGEITAVLDIQQAKLLKAQTRFDNLFATGGEQRLIQEQDQWIAPNRLRVVWKQSGQDATSPSYPTVERP